MLRTLRDELCGLISCQSSFWLASSIFSPADAISAARRWPRISKIRRQPEQLWPNIETTQKLLRGSGDPCFGYAPTGDCNIADLLIDYANHTKCADIRDKIIGILGLHNCGGSLGSYARPLKLSYGHVAQTVLQTLDHIPAHIIEMLEEGRGVVLWELLRTMLEGGDPSNTPFEMCRLQFQYGRAFELVLKDVWTPKPQTGTIHHKSALRIAPYTRLSTITSSRGQREAVHWWWPQGQRDHPQFRYLRLASLLPYRTCR